MMASLPPLSRDFADKELMLITSLPDNTEKAILERAENPPGCSGVDAPYDHIDIDNAGLALIGQKHVCP